jgi:hypothetical protein
MTGAKKMLNHVVCVKWGNKYSVNYVNTLKNMCDRHITVPYQFHCFTENKQGIDNGINIIDLPTLPGIKTWWSKLYMFSPVSALHGTILYFDLDVVIFRNIDHFFSHDPGQFMIIRDFNRCRVKDWNLSNSSCMRWQSGTMHYLWQEFQNNPTTIMQNNHGDQDWITKRAKQDIRHWPDEWIRSYKWEMLERTQTKIKNGQKWIHDIPPKITQENCVAVFHGKPDPHECGDQFVIDNWR